MAIFDIKNQWKITSGWIKRVTTRPDDNPLPLKEAMDFFDRFSSRRDLVLDIFENGCQARAHLMCKEIADSGRKAYKAWAFSKALQDAQHIFKEGEETLKVTLPDGRKIMHEGQEGWYFHVALALPVQTTPRWGEYLVFDPCLFDGPVSLRQWGQVLSAPSYGLQIQPFGRTPSGFFGDYIPTQGGTKAALKDPRTNPIEILKRLRDEHAERPRSVFSSAYRKLNF